MANRLRSIIRLRRRGAKFAPFFEIGLCYNTTRAKGSFIEKLGYYNPNSLDRMLVLNMRRLGQLLNKGAHLHSSVKKILGQALKNIK